MPRNRASSRIFEGIDVLLGGVTTWLVEGSRRRPRLALGLCLLATLVSGGLAATGLTVDTDPDRLTSSELAFRRTNAAIAEAFPQLQDNLVVLVEAPRGADARAAAEELAARLRADEERFLEVFLPGDDPFFEDNGLFFVEDASLDEMDERIDRSGPLLATLAEQAELPILIAALTHAVSSEDGLDSLGEDGGRVLEQVAVAVERFGRGESSPIAWGDLLFEDLGVDHDTSQVLLVRPRASLAELDPALAAIARVRAVAAELAPREGLTVRVTGDLAVHSEEMSMVLGEVTLAGVASLVLVTLILFYALGSFRLMLATLLTLLVGLAWTAGVAAVAVGHLNVLTVAFAVLYIGLGADFVIHFAIGYLEQKTPQRGVSTALRATGRRVGASLGLCAATTAIGFYAFIPTSYSAVAELGVISGTGVFLSLLATLTIYPALIALGLGQSEKLAEARIVGREIPLPSFPLHRPRTVCAVALLALVASFAVLQHVRFDMDPLNVRDPRVESVQAMTELLAARDVSAWSIEALVDDLDEAARLAARLEAMPEVHEVHTAMSFVPADQAERLERFARMREALSSPVELDEEERGQGEDLVRDLRWTIEGYGVALDIDAELRGDTGEDDPLVAKAERLRAALLALHARLPEEDPDGEAAAALGLHALQRDVFGDLAEVLAEVKDALPTQSFSLADLPASIRDRYLAPDGRARIEVFSSTNLHRRGALEAFADLVHGEVPQAGGAVVATVEFGRAIKHSLEQALWMAVVVIAALLLFLWRSLKFTLITLAPLLIGGVLTAAFTVVADVPFNFANVIVLPLILGMGVDAGIHLVHRHRIGLYGARDLMHTSTARAVLFSAATTVVSFATLTFSHHMGIASLAQLLTAGIAFMLIANVVVLPAILVLFDERTRTGQPLPQRRGAPSRGIAGEVVSEG